VGCGGSVGLTSWPWCSNALKCPVLTIIVSPAGRCGNYTTGTQIKSFFIDGQYLFFIFLQISLYYCRYFF